MGDAFEAYCNGLYTHGTCVVPVAGKNYWFDELFLFAAAADAHKFYGLGFHNRELFRESENGGCGVQRCCSIKSDYEFSTRRVAVTHE